MIGHLVAQPFRAARAARDTGRPKGLRYAVGVVFIAANAAAQTPLTLKDAEQRAVAAHPVIRAGQELALAAGENVREARSAYFPTAFGSFTAAGAMDGTRIAAGSLNNPTILDRFAGGL